MDDYKSDITNLIRGVTAKWKQVKRSADRDDRVSRASLQRMMEPPRTTIREVAFAVMEDAYNKASSNGRYYANARQIMYAARPAILEQCGKHGFNSVYFTQTLLKDYLEEYEPDWKVVWDARGHLIEPFTQKTIALGGIDVTKYLGKWHDDVVIGLPEIDERVDTHGPGNRYANALFIEKEGFTEILKGAGIPERFDMALLSTKGIPVGAACELVSKLDSGGVNVFVLHDFDLSGLKILKTLRKGARLSPGTDVIDLGLRMGDVGDLLSEPVEYRQRQNPRHYLRECGATDDEIKMLVSSKWPPWQGERVEINAMTSEQLINWLERKFEEHSVKKVVPSDDVLVKTYRRAVTLSRIMDEMREKHDEADKEEDAEGMEGLGAKVAELLEKCPSMSWDSAVWQIAEESTL